MMIAKVKMEKAERMVKTEKVLMEMVMEKNKMMVMVKEEEKNRMKNYLKFTSNNNNYARH